MTHQSPHWCPANGCGKSVVYLGNRGLKFGYQCKRCGKRFTKDQVWKFRKGDNYDKV